MIELLPWVFKALLRSKTIQPTKTETFTQRSIDINAHRKWNAEQFQQMQANTDKWISRPHAERVITGFKKGGFTTTPTGGPIGGITGGPPMKETKTTVTYATGKPRTVKF
jgi:hypothetical protein